MSGFRARYSIKYVYPVQYSKQRLDNLVWSDLPLVCAFRKWSHCCKYSLYFYEFNSKKMANVLFSKNHRGLKIEKNSKICKFANIFLLLQKTLAKKNMGKFFKNFILGPIMGKTVFDLVKGSLLCWDSFLSGTVMDSLLYILLLQ